jgi:hypothetical protein
MVKNQGFISKSRKKRLEFAEEMLKKESDWGFMFISDEMSIWLNKSKPQARWVKLRDSEMEIEEGSPTNQMEIEDSIDDQDSKNKDLFF